jgi:hypothetical protein
MDEQTVALMRANLYDVFGERDDARRAEAVRRTYTDTIRFTDEQGTVTGHEAVDQRARAVLEEAPGDFVFAEDGPVYGDATRAALAWRFGPPDGDPVVRGVDVATVVDGRIDALETLLAPGR